MKLNTNYKIIFLILSSEEKGKKRSTYQYLLFLFILNNLIHFIMSQAIITTNKDIIIPSFLEDFYTKRGSDPHKFAKSRSQKV